MTQETNYNYIKNENDRRIAMGLPKLTKRATKSLSEMTEYDIEEYLNEVRNSSKRLYSNVEEQEKLVLKIKQKILNQIKTESKDENKTSIENTDSLLGVNESAKIFSIPARLILSNKNEVSSSVPTISNITSPDIKTNTEQTPISSRERSDTELKNRREVQRIESLSSAVGRLDLQQLQTNTLLLELRNAVKDLEKRTSESQTRRGGGLLGAATDALMGRTVMQQLLRGSLGVAGGILGYSIIDDFFSENDQEDNNENNDEGNESPPQSNEISPTTEESEEQIYQRLLEESPSEFQDDIDYQNDLRSEARLIFENNRRQQTTSIVPQVSTGPNNSNDIIRVPGESTRDFNRRVRENQQRLVDQNQNRPDEIIDPVIQSIIPSQPTPVISRQDAENAGVLSPQGTVTPLPLNQVTPDIPTNIPSVIPQSVAEPIISQPTPVISRQDAENAGVLSPQGTVTPLPLNQVTPDIPTNIQQTTLPLSTTPIIPSETPEVTDANNLVTPASYSTQLSVPTDNNDAIAVQTNDAIAVDIENESIPQSQESVDRQIRERDQEENLNQLFGTDLILRARKLTFKGDEIRFSGETTNIIPNSGATVPARIGTNITGVTPNITQNYQNGTGGSVPATPGSTPPTNDAETRVPNENLTFARGVDNRINQGIADKVRQVESATGKSFIITSGYRDPVRNARTGAANSAHMRHNAVDIQFRGNEQDTIKVIEAASAAGVGGIGVYRPGFLHLDTEGRRAWGPTFRYESVPGWARGAIEAHMTGRRQQNSNNAGDASPAPAQSESGGITPATGSGDASPAPAQSESGGTAPVVTGTTGIESTPVASSPPSVGAELVGASTEAEVQDRVPPNFTEVATGANEYTPGNPTVDAPNYSHEPNDPGLVEPEDAAERYVRLFHLAA